jgi:hypothetical protein
MSGVRDFSTAPRLRAPVGLDALALGVGLLAAVAAASSAWGAWSDLGRAQAAVARAQGELAAARQRVRSQGPDSTRLDDTLASRVLLSRVAPPSQVVAELGSLLPARVRLDSLRLSYGDRLELELRVRARGPREYDGFLQQLRSSGRFVEILPGDEVRGEQELSASVRLVRRESGFP